MGARRGIEKRRMLAEKRIRQAARVAYAEMRLALARAAAQALEMQLDLERMRLKRLGVAP